MDALELRLNQVEWSAKVIRSDCCWLQLGELANEEVNYLPETRYMSLDASEDAEYPRDPGLIPAYP